MKNEKIEQAISEYLESKELVLMSYPPEYIENVKTDMEVAFRKGAEWMAGQGETIDGEILTTSDYGWETIRIPKKLYPLGTKVTIQIRKK